MVSPLKRWPLSTAFALRARLRRGASRLTLKAPLAVRLTLAPRHWRASSCARARLSQILRQSLDRVEADLAGSCRRLARFRRAAGAGRSPAAPRTKPWRRAAGCGFSQPIAASPPRLRDDRSSICPARRQARDFVEPNPSAPRSSFSPRRCVRLKRGSALEGSSAKVSPQAWQKATSSALRKPSSGRASVRRPLATALSMPAGRRCRSRAAAGKSPSRLGRPRDGR